MQRASNERGVCDAGDGIEVARVGLHHWEEPPISGESGSGTIFFNHCPLKCVYCQNYRISGSSSGRILTEEELAYAMLKLQREGALNINLVTPTHYADRIRQSIDIAKSEGLSLPIVWNTSGYELPEQIEANEGYVDVYLTDFKYFDAKLSRELSSCADYFDIAMDALDKMVEIAGSVEYDSYEEQMRMTKGVLVRHMILPGHLDDSKTIISSLYERFKDKILFSIMNQYTPVLASRAENGDAHAKKILEIHPELARDVSDAEYESLLDHADSIGIEDYFWQEKGTVSESFIPDF